MIIVIDYTWSDTEGRHETLPIDLDDETMAIRRVNEVSNGRLAMLAFWELVREDIAGQAPFEGMPDYVF